MAALTFKKLYIEPILRGEKTSTLRARKPRFDIGEVVAARCEWSKPAFAQLKVVAIEFVDAEHIPDEMAREDGYESADDLRERLAKTYPDVRFFWLIRFESMPA